jgi:3-hydroxyisobutyrate dehydrogenase
MSQQPSVAVLGLGIMGASMARRLVDAGFPVMVFNRSRAKADPLAAAGAAVADSPRAAAEASDIVIAMVADDHASREVWLGSRGALEGARAGSVLVESSTLSVGWVKELARAAEAQGCDLVDAPVTGSRLQAAAGELNFLVGGTPDSLARVRPALGAMGRSVTYLGPTGSGALVKLINNFMAGVQLTSLAEAMVLIERSGLDRDKTVEVLLNGAPGSLIVRTIAGRITADDYTPNFLLRLLAKDLGYAIDEGRDCSVELRTAAAALAWFREAIAAGDGEKDMAALVQQIRRS